MCVCALHAVLCDPGMWVSCCRGVQHPSASLHVSAFLHSLDMEEEREEVKEEEEQEGVAVYQSAPPYLPPPLPRS